jgi:MFS-type transporter involved in bile tolerance (Atg22 family)
MLAALSTGHKLGLGLSGLAFVVFALVAAVVAPRLNPDFPGRRKPLFLFVSFLFFVWMVAAVLVFGKEEKHEGHREAVALIVQR